MKKTVDIQKISYTWPGENKAILTIDSLEIKQGETVLLRGKSGSGKTTLLSLIAGINTVDTGHLSILGKELKNSTPQERDRFRGDRIGFIFQQFNLLPYLTVQENILAPLLFSPVKREKESRNTEERVLSLLENLDLQVDPGKSVMELSIGQQQRVAAARAFMGEPELIIADEPTSALDTESGKVFLNLLFHEARRLGSTLIVVSHDSSLKGFFDREESLSRLNRTQGRGDV